MIMKRINFLSKRVKKGTVLTDEECIEMQC